MPVRKPGVRRFGRVNRLGLATLYVKEIRRLLKVWPQTIFAPVVTTLLFFTCSCWPPAAPTSGRCSGSPPPAP